MRAPKSKKSGVLGHMPEAAGLAKRSPFGRSPFHDSDEDNPETTRESTERHKRQARANAAAYSKALRRLRDENPERFEELWTEEKGAPRQYDHRESAKRRGGE